MAQYQYTFFGKVFPERARVEIGSVDCKISDYLVKISIFVSQVSAVVHTEREVSDVATLKNEVESYVRLLVDLYGFIKVCGYDVEITSVVYPNGALQVFGVGGWDSLTKAVGKRPLPLGELIKVANKDQAFKEVIADLREAIRMPKDTGFFTYRAIEKIRQAFRKPGDGEDKRKSWERLRKSLNIEQSFIDEIKEVSEAQRHGEAVGMSWEERLDAMRRAWKVVDKYTEHIAGS